MRKIFYIFQLTFCFSLTGNIFAHSAPSTILVDDIFLKIRNAATFKVMGFEVISQTGAQNSMPVTSSLITALNQLDPLALSRVIAKESDYECLIGKDYFIIVPKDDASKHERATAKETIQISDINEESFNDVFAQVNKLNSKGRPILLGLPYAMGMAPSESISLKAGRYKCYELLNEMAMQLKAKCWTIDHLPVIDLKTHTLAVPIILAPGCVTFFGS